MKKLGRLGRGVLFAACRHSHFAQERFCLFFVRAVVTMVTSNPMLRLILSSSTSGKIAWSETPSV
jgi:hypothetical protein